MEFILLPVGCVPRCPGCEHRSLTQEESLLKKQNDIRWHLASWSDLIEAPAILSEERRLGYREKTCLRARWTGAQWDFGFLIKKRGSREKEWVGIVSCPVHSARVQKILGYFSSFLPEAKHFPLAFLVISGSLVTLVLKAALLPELSFLKTVRLDDLGLTGLFVNLNPCCGERVFSNRGWHFVSGEKRGVFQIQGTPFYYGPGSFQQAIPDLYLSALEKALQFFSLLPTDGVMDLCSGIGISLSLWRSAGASTLGVELQGESARFACENLKAELVLQGRASDRIPQLREWMRSVEGRLFVFANPPRSGLEGEVLDWIIHEVKPPKMAYLSCSAATLARDLSLLPSPPFRVYSIQPFDLFPRTRHVEVLALVEVKP